MIKILLLLTHCVILAESESVDNFVTNPFLFESNSFDNPFLLGTIAFFNPFCDQSNEFDNDFKKSILIYFRYYYCKI